MRKQTKQPHSPRVFISHASVDNILARKIRNILSQALDARVFTTEDLSAGEDWESELRRELSQSDFVVALLTPQSVRSNFLMHELGAAWALHKPMISLISRRDVLNSIPLTVDESQMIMLDDVDNPVMAEGLARRFAELVPVH